MAGIRVQWNGILMSGEILRVGCGNELVRRQCEWCWYAGWGVLTRVGGGCKPDFVRQYRNLFIYVMNYS